MGKYPRKCSGGIGELAAMDVTRVAGVRTRAQKAHAVASSLSKRRKAATAVAPAGAPTSYLQLRSRRLVLTTRQARTRTNSAARPGISQCPNDASIEVAFQDAQDLEVSHQCFTRDRKKTTPSSELEPTAGIKSRRRSMAREGSPWEAEIEEFLAAAESEARRRFADKYNYDVAEDGPVDGRYEWVRI